MAIVQYVPFVPLMAQVAETHFYTFTFLLAYITIFLYQITI